MYILEMSSVSRERRAKRNVERNNGRKKNKAFSCSQLCSAHSINGFRVKRSKMKARKKKKDVLFLVAKERKKEVKRGWVRWFPICAPGGTIRSGQLFCRQ